ncbi:MAG: UDP-N-acetylglucosamine 2-epimerase [Candidatus Bilamarchaeaceae archaeon]
MGRCTGSSETTILSHTEAGLRSFNREMPEGQNRMLTDHCADLLFCPVQVTVDNLAREGITEGVHLVGDAMYDGVLQFAEVAYQRSTILEDSGLKPKTYFLATVHPPHDTGNPEKLRDILTALAKINERTVFAIHPRTRQKMAELGLLSSQSTALNPHSPNRNPRFIKPLGCLHMLMLEQNARLIWPILAECKRKRISCRALRDIVSRDKMGRAKRQVGIKQ